MSDLEDRTANASIRRPPAPEPLPTPTMAATAPDRLAYQPALDGLRGLAVAAVVLYHAAAADGLAWLERWTRGGFLGVSAFFTLSGFLICSLLLRERRRSATVSPRAFWRRRARRLLPAVLLLIVAVVLLTPLVGTEAQLASLPGDAWASLFYVANWHFVLGGADYAAIFSGDPSPLRHLWSLAVEEQWYLLLPVAALAAAAAARRSRIDRRGLVVAVAAVVVAGTIWMFAVSGGSWDNRAYMGTGTRLAEMAVGALAAVLLSGGLVVSPRLRRVLARTAPLLFVALLGMWAFTPIRADWLYRGGLTLHALVVGVLIVAVVQPDGLVRRLLSGAALVRIGQISYGVYLFHWPIVWWLSPERLGTGPGVAVLAQVALSLGVAAISFVVLERPVRTGSALGGARGVVAGLAAFGVAAAAILMLPDPDRSAVVALGSGVEVAIPTTTTAPVSPPAAAGATSDPVAPTTTVAPPPPPPLRVMVVGDSFAESIVIGLQRWGVLDGGAAVMDRTVPACPFGRGGRNRGVGIARGEEQECRDRDRSTLEAIAEFDPELVVVAGGMWDVTDRRPSGFSRWTSIGHPAYDEFLRRELHHVIDVVTADGARVLWANAPHWDPVPGSVIFMGDPPYAESDPARVDAYNALLASVVAERPEVELLDIADWMRSQPGGEFEPSLRPDGVHFSEESTERVATWLGPLLLTSAGR